MVLFLERLTILLTPARFSKPCRYLKDYNRKTNPLKISLDWTEVQLYKIECSSGTKQKEPKVLKYCRAELQSSLKQSKIIKCFMHDLQY
jgi:hypothetical protein